MSCQQVRCFAASDASTHFAGDGAAVAIICGGVERTGCLGPGCYSPVVPVKQAQGAAFSIAGRWAGGAKEQEEGPAPGAYELPAGEAIRLLWNSQSTKAVKLKKSRAWHAGDLCSE
jgi:hypothetical protein